MLASKRRGSGIVLCGGKGVTALMTWTVQPHCSHPLAVLEERIEQYEVNTDDNAHCCPALTPLFTGARKI